ncbi:hypothetical protein MN608_06033 [Microdochium nivale]|nr:hypothetical protein MN608_06033 [Microdochium nivale]
MSSPPRHNEARARTTHVRTDSLLDQLADTDEQSIVDEGQILSTKTLHSSDLETPIPALPERSSLRASRLLEDLRLDSIKSATHSFSTSHDVYLSSEEDASSSADDFSAEELDLDDDDDEDLLETPGSASSLPASRRSLSREVTARVVSVVFVGRPSIVELSPKSKTFPPPTPLQRPQIPQRSPSRSSFAPRRSSLLKTQPSFLDTDPWANHRSNSEPTIEEDSQNLPTTPRTPTAVLNRFQKSLSIVRKRSRANLKTGVDSVRVDLSSLHTRNSSAMTLGAFIAPSTEVASPVYDAAQGPNRLVKTHNRSNTQTIAIDPAASAGPAPALAPAPARRGLLSGFKKQRRSSLKI